MYSIDFFFDARVVLVISMARWGDTEHSESGRQVQGYHG